MSEAAYPHLNKVGLELEGGWKNRVFLDADIHEDISVPNPGYGNVDYHWGEIASPPLLPSEAVPWLRKHYPLDIPVPTDGKSCGFHIHVSPKVEGDYNKLLSRTFHNFYLEGIGGLGEHIQPYIDDAAWFAWRLKGSNRFARRLYAPSRQVWCEEKDSGRDAERRTLINYCHGLHGTVEVRLFPMFNKLATAEKALEMTLELFESFLAKREGKQDRPSGRKVWVGDLLESVR